MRGQRYKNDNGRTKLFREMEEEEKELEMQKQRRRRLRITNKKYDGRKGAGTRDAGTEGRSVRRLKNTNGNERSNTERWKRRN